MFRERLFLLKHMPQYDLSGLTPGAAPDVGPTLHEDRKAMNRPNLLREDIKGGNPFARDYGVTVDSSLEEFERAAVSHPVFVLERK